MPFGTPNSPIVPVSNTARLAASVSDHWNSRTALVATQLEKFTVANANKSLDTTYGGDGSTSATTGDPAGTVSTVRETSVEAPRKFVATQRTTAAPNSRDAGKVTEDPDSEASCAVRLAETLTLAEPSAVHSYVRGREADPTAVKVAVSHKLTWFGPVSVTAGRDTSTGASTVTECSTDLSERPSSAVSPPDTERVPP
eukprot:CAMPEP_0114165578 /NCGR_PEP_ID=MMETSP0043_2-20121206/31333_1 /TAXON_ID=464988 /ORGANISM="Hemiselmis andersenii, Strain CCMP644" /LENGTH=197 /DNA_ID=CAMNT_0001262429 /DNA_START=30 /DNA_END=619 /DNA_ORIENTATION=+